VGLPRPDQLLLPARAPTRPRSSAADALLPEQLAGSRKLTTGSLGSPAALLGSDWLCAAASAVAAKLGLARPEAHACAPPPHSSAAAACLPACPPALRSALMAPPAAVAAAAVASPQGPVAADCARVLPLRDSAPGALLVSGARRADGCRKEAAPAQPLLLLPPPPPKLSSSDAAKLLALLLPPLRAPSPLHAPCALLRDLLLGSCPWAVPLQACCCDACSGLVRSLLALSAAGRFAGGARIACASDGRHCRLAVTVSCVATHETASLAPPWCVATPSCEFYACCWAHRSQLLSFDRASGVLQEPGEDDMPPRDR
jgi:hypothetical protein